MGDEKTEGEGEVEPTGSSATAGSKGGGQSEQRSSGRPQESDDGGIDPNEADDYKRGERYRCRDGRKLFRAVGMLRDETGSGTPYVTIMLVCLKDYEKPGFRVDRNSRDQAWVKDPDLAPPSDEGLSCRVKFHDTEKSRPRIASFAREMGRTTRFSFKNDDDIADIAFGAEGTLAPLFIGEVEIDVDDRGNEWGECVSWERFEGERDPAWEALFDKGIADFEEAGKKREEKQRREAENRGGGRGGGRGKGRGGGGGGGGRGDRTDKRYGFHHEPRVRGFGA